MQRSNVFSHVSVCVRVCDSVCIVLWLLIPFLACRYVVRIFTSHSYIEVIRSRSSGQGHQVKVIRSRSLRQGHQVKVIRSRSSGQGHQVKVICQGYKVKVITSSHQVKVTGAKKAHFCVQQVSQGSVDTLFISGWKSLHYFVANLFRILSTKFYWNQTRFVKNTTKTFRLTSL